MLLNVGILQYIFLLTSLNSPLIWIILHVLLNSLRCLLDIIGFPNIFFRFHLNSKIVLNLAHLMNLPKHESKQSCFSSRFLESFYQRKKLNRALFFLFLDNSLEVLPIFWLLSNFQDFWVYKFSYHSWSHFNISN